MKCERIDILFSIHIIVLIGVKTNLSIKSWQRYFSYWLLCLHCCQILTDGVGGGHFEGGGGGTVLVSYALMIDRFSWRGMIGKKYE